MTELDFKIMVKGLLDATKMEMVVNVIKIAGIELDYNELSIEYLRGKLEEVDEDKFDDAQFAKLKRYRKEVAIRFVTMQRYIKEHFEKHWLAIYGDIPAGMLNEMELSADEYFSKARAEDAEKINK